MLERLRVRNFRGFENLGVDRLRRINLVAGRNDTGKSTLPGGDLSARFGGQSPTGSQ